MLAAAIKFPSSESWLRIGVNDVILSKVLHDGIEITITIRTVIRPDNKRTLALTLDSAIFFTTCHNFSPCCVFEKSTSFTLILNQDETREIYGGRKFSELQRSKKSGL